MGLTNFPDGVDVGSVSVDSVEITATPAQINAAAGANALNGHTTSAADALAIPVTHRYVAKTTGGDAEALTLADGTIVGQRVNITLVVDGGGDGTLTPAHPTGFATIVFADAGDTAALEWTGTGWIILGLSGKSAAPAAT